MNHLVNFLTIYAMDRQFVFFKTWDLDLFSLIMVVMCLLSSCVCYLSSLNQDQEKTFIFMVNINPGPHIMQVFLLRGTMTKRTKPVIFFIIVCQCSP